MSDDLSLTIDANIVASPTRKLRETISDAYAFIRSMEANQALATVTLEQMMEDQIKRNGESRESNSQQYDPTTYDPTKNVPETQVPEERANFLGGSDTSRPTKLDRVLAIVNAISAVVKEIKAKETVDVAKPSEYTDSSTISVKEA